MVVDCSCYCQPFLGSQPGASPICRFDLPVNHQHIRFWYFLSSHLHYSRALGLRADQCIIWKRLAECSSFDPPQWVHSAHRVVMGDVCSGASNVCWLSPASRCYSKCIEAVQLIRDFGLCFSSSVSSKAELTWRLCGKVVDGCVTICSCVCCYDLQRVHWFGDYGGCNRLSYVFLRLYLYPSFLPEKHIYM